MINVIGSPALLLCLSYAKASENGVRKM